MEIPDPVSVESIKPRVIRRIDLTNQRFGILTVIRFVGVHRRAGMWECVCDCGNIIIERAALLRNGERRSCGCRKGGYRHGMARTRTYRAWIEMRARCYNKHHISYKRYGGRGIAVCARWHDSFENFLLDMGEVPHGCTLERVNNNNGYAPNNCTWATPKQQANNRCTTVFDNTCWPPKLKGVQVCS